MNSVIIRTRRIANIRRDTTLPQYITPPRRTKAHPLFIAAPYVASALIIITLILFAL